MRIQDIAGHLISEVQGREILPFTYNGEVREGFRIHDIRQNLNTNYYYIVAQRGTEYRSFYPDEAQ